MLVTLSGQRVGVKLISAFFMLSKANVLSK